MGAILAKFRKEKTTTQVLEALEEEIKTIEKFSYNTQEQKKRIVGNFLAVSIGVYVIAFIIFYFVYFPPTWRERVIYSIPLLLFPFIIILLRRLFSWYFQRKLNKNSNKLTELRDKKKKILEQVMDKETYKVAVKLLARFGNDRPTLKSYGMTPSSTPAPVPANQAARTIKPLPNNQLVRRPLTYSFNSPANQTPRPQPTNTANALASRVNTTPVSSMALASMSPGSPMQGLRRRTPFPIINQQSKTAFDRIVDVLIGDGPQDRFAMICKECHSHNGMALKEDFEYTTFRCAFCNTLNPSRKARPVAPRLQLSTDLPVSGVSNDDSSSDSSSDDEADMKLLNSRFEVNGQRSSETESVNDESTDLLNNESVMPVPVATNGSTETEITDQIEYADSDAVEEPAMEKSASEPEADRIDKNAENKLTEVDKSGESQSTMKTDVQEKTHDDNEE